MAQISTYVKDTDLSIRDAVIGTETVTNRTVNFPLGGIFGLHNTEVFGPAGDNTLVMMQDDVIIPSALSSSTSTHQVGLTRSGNLRDAIFLMTDRTTLKVGTNLDIFSQEQVAVGNPLIIRNVPAGRAIANTIRAIDEPNRTITIDYILEDGDAQIFGATGDAANRVTFISYDRTRIEGDVTIAGNLTFQGTATSVISGTVTLEGNVTGTSTFNDEGVTTINTVIPADSVTEEQLTPEVRAQLGGSVEVTKASVDAAIGVGDNNTDYYASDKTWRSIPEGNEGTVTEITTGAGLSGGPITSSGEISLSSTVEDRIAANDSKRTYPQGDQDKVNHISVTQAVDLDNVENLAESALQQSDVSLDGSTLSIGTQDVNVGGGSITVSERVGTVVQDTQMDVNNIQFRGPGVIVSMVDGVVVVDIPGGSASGNTTRTLNPQNQNFDEFNNYVHTFTFTGNVTAVDDATIQTVILRTANETDRTVTVPSGANNVVSINETYTGIDFPSNSRTFTLIVTATNSEGEALTVPNTVRTFTINKLAPTNPTIGSIVYNGFDLALATSDSQIEQWDSGTIAFSVTPGLSRDWIQGAVQATTSPITVNGTVGENPAISVRIPYTPPAGATNSTADRTATRTWTTIRSLRFGFIPANAGVAAPIFQDNATTYTEDATSQATIGLRHLPNFMNTSGNEREIQRANNDAGELNNDVLTFNSVNNQRGYLFIIVDSAVTLSQIFDLQVNSNIINNFTPANNVAPTIGGYRVYITPNQLSVDNYQVRLNT